MHQLWYGKATLILLLRHQSPISLQEVLSILVSLILVRSSVTVTGKLTLTRSRESIWRWERWNACCSMSQRPDQVYNSGIAQCQGYAGTRQVPWPVSGESGIAQCQRYAGTRQVPWPVSGKSGIAHCQGYAGTRQVPWPVSGESGIALSLQPGEPAFKSRPQWSTVINMSSPRLS